MVEFADIITTVAGFVTGGGLATLFTLKERKKGAALDNVGKTNDEWRKMADEYKLMIADLKSDLERKDGKIDELYKELSVMRDKADKLGSKVAYLTTMKCKVIGCPNRVPPFGTKEPPKQCAQGEAAEA